MSSMQRRSFCQLALAALPSTLLAQIPNPQIPNPQIPNSASAAKPVRVPAGTDREEKKHAIGLSSTTHKVLTQETGGALFVIEQSNH